MTPKKKTPPPPPPKAPRRGKARTEYDLRTQAVAVHALLSGRMTAVEAMHHFNVQTNQLHSWAAKALLGWRPDAVQALASNPDLMQLLDAARAGRGLPNPAAGPKGR